MRDPHLLCSVQWNILLVTHHTLKPWNCEEALLLCKYQHWSCMTYSNLCVELIMPVWMYKKYVVLCCTLLQLQVRKSTTCFQSLFWNFNYSCIDIFSFILFFQRAVYVYICNVYNLVSNRTNLGYVSNCWYDFKIILFCSALFSRYRCGVISIKICSFTSFLIFNTRNLFPTHKWYKKHCCLFHVRNLFIGVDTITHFYLDYYYMDICRVLFDLNSNEYKTPYILDHISTISNLLLELKFIKCITKWWKYAASR